MKPTRNIVKPNKGLWNCNHKTWAKHNDDSKLGEEQLKFDDKKASENISDILKNPKLMDKIKRI